ncbi:MAG: 30S ribosomal protein S15 [Candidatus Aenigmarchaeota archaeon]|nr:30S ribosomal protein S15 [Candidatus Aenigmarchaeota archaeon]
MARIYSGKKGRSGSHRPPHKSIPKWVKYSKADVEGMVAGLAKQKYSSSMIGTILRDTHGIPDVQVIAGKPVSGIMKESGNYPEIPEDLLFLLRKAVNLRKHMSSNKQDKHSKRGLQNLESKIRRLVKYYVRTKKLPSDWRYDPEKARLIIQKG